jgi:hypothetical protein
MLKRRLLALIFGATAALSVSGSQAFAWMSYCDWDPPVLILTPGGNLVAVHDSVWTSSLLNIGLPVSGYTATRVYGPEGQPETAVDMTVSVPTELLWHYHYTAFVATGPLLSGQVLAYGQGYGTAPVHLKFVLPEA